MPATSKPGSLGIQFLPIHLGIFRIPELSRDLCARFCLIPKPPEERTGAAVVVWFDPRSAVWQVLDGRVQVDLLAADRSGDVAL